MSRPDRSTAKLAREQPSQTPERRRLRLGEPLPMTLTAADMQAVFDLSPSGFHKAAARGDFDAFRLRRPIGHAQYSGALLAAFLIGDQPSRHFHRGTLEKARALGIRLAG